MLAELPRKYVALQPAGSMGTNRAFLGKYDGAGQSTKARQQQLYEWTADMEV